MEVNFEKAFQNGQNMEFNGNRFDDPSYDNLVVTEENYLEALQMQAAGIAYYGTLYKQIENKLDEVQRQYHFRYNEMYADCNNSLSRLGKKNTVKDIEALVQTKYEKELEILSNNLTELKSKRDMASVYFEAWKAKGFVLNSMTALVTANLLTVKTTITEDSIEQNKKQKFLECLRNKE